MLNKGIDISHFQSEASIDWTKVKADGIDFVYVKCTQGLRFVDPLCSSHASNARGHGVKIGYYHFAEPDVSAFDEANFFHAQLLKLPKADIMPVLDIEENKSHLDSAQIESWISTFVSRMMELGHEIMIYSYQPYLDQYLPTTHQFGTLPLWLAQYRNVASPSLPKGWATASLWQYANNGKLEGISVPVDMNKALDQKFALTQTI